MPEARAVGSQWGAAAAVGVAALALQLLFSHVLELSEYGLFTAATAAAAIAYVVQGGGYRQLILRETVARSAGFPPIDALHAQARGFILAVTGLACLLVLAGAPWLTAALPAMIAIAANAPRLIANLVSAELLGRERFADEARWQMLSRLLPFAAGAGAALAGLASIGVLAAMFAAQALVLLRKPAGTRPHEVRLSAKLTPLAAVRDLLLIELFTQVYSRQPILFLYALGAPLEEIGRFGLLQRLLEAYAMLLAPLAVMYANRVRAGGCASAEAGRLFRRVAIGATAVVAIALAVNATVGDRLLAALGPAFAPALGRPSPAAAWLLAGALLMAPSFLIGQALLAANRERAFVAIALGATLAGAAAALVLTPGAGALGAAQALFVTEFALFAMLGRAFLALRRAGPGASRGGD